MASKKVIYKKEDLREFVAGNRDIKSQLLESSALLRYAETESPSLRPDLRLCFLTAGFIITGFVALSSGPSVITIENKIGMLGLMSFILGILNLQYIIFLQKRKIKSLSKALNEPVAELIYTKEYLENYLKNVDRRTSKYFNMVTDNKVSNYLLLNNIHLSLKDTIAEIMQYSNKPSAKSLRMIQSILKSDISVHDGAGFSAGIIYSVPLAKLTDTVDVLANNLEKSIMLLESDLRLQHDRYENELMN